MRINQSKNRVCYLSSSHSARPCFGFRWEGYQWENQLTAELPPLASCLQPRPTFYIHKIPLIIEREVSQNHPPSETASWAKSSNTAPLPCKDALLLFSLVSPCLVKYMFLLKYSEISPDSRRSTHYGLVTGRLSLSLLLAPPLLLIPSIKPPHSPPIPFQMHSKLYLLLLNAAASSLSPSHTSHRYVSNPFSLPSPAEISLHSRNLSGQHDAKPCLQTLQM